MRSWQGLSDRSKYALIVVGERRHGVASSEYDNLVAQHDDLRILRTAQTNGQTCHRRMKPLHDTKHGVPLIGRVLLGQRARPSFGLLQESWDEPDEYD